MAILTYTKLENAFVNGTNQIKSGDLREWSNVKATGRIRKNRFGQAMTEVIDPNVKTNSKTRWLNMSTFTGTVVYPCNTRQTFENGHKVETHEKQALYEKQVIEVFYGMNEEALQALSYDNIIDSIVKEN